MTARPARIADALASLGTEGIDRLRAQAKKAQAQMDPWDRDSFNWPIAREHPVIVELGVYEGRWLAGMLARYAELQPTLIGFEPQAWAFERARQTLAPLAAASDSTLDLRPYGVTILADREEVELRAFHTDAASVLIDDTYYRRHPEERRRDVGMVELRPLADELGSLERIDVLMMNIEGYEYPLLWRMLELGMLERIEHLAVQWHRGHDPAGDAERRIRQRLDETHDVIFDYGATLVGWAAREAAQEV